MNSSSSEWYLRIEAVNLDHSVYDTNDISTIRGGSSLLLDAVQKIAEKPELKRVSVGASTGLFEVEVKTDAEITSIETQIRKYLQGEPYRHFATFVITTSKRERGESIVDVNNRLMSECSLQQYQTPSFAFPAYEKSAEECGFGGTRPAVCDIGGKERKASHAVYVRREKGKALRKELYMPCLDKESPDIELPDHLEELAQNDNIAVIHFDGNRFGKIRDQCKIKEDYERFDNAIQGIQKQAICQIVKHTPEIGNKIRLETLLWGGDEIELVVPAHQAWATLKRFFDATGTETFQTEEKEFTLTWSAGVVFCRHNLPILQVRRYVEQLCSIAKQRLSDKPDEFSSGDNRIAYLNMSSFDLIERDVESFIASYHAPATVRDFNFTINEIDQLHTDMLTITRSFPKNKIYEIAELLQSGTSIDSLEERALQMVDSATKQPLEEAISRILGERKERWLLIGDLWNLIGAQAL